MIEAVLFDIGGVLEVTPPTGWQQGWAARLGLEPGKLEDRLSTLFAAGAIGNSTLEEVERGIAAALALDGAATASFMEDLWTEYLGTLNVELAEYFAALRPRFRTGILSNSFVGAREREQRLYGFEALCDELVYSHEEGFVKPDARLYRIACDRLGTVPERSVLLDDTLGHVEGARAIGMHSIRFIDNAQAIGDLERLLGAGAN